MGATVSANSRLRAILLKLAFLGLPGPPGMALGQCRLGRMWQVHPVPGDHPPTECPGLRDTHGKGPISARPMDLLSRSLAPRGVSGPKEKGPPEGAGQPMLKLGP